MDKVTRKFVPKSVRLMDQVREILRLYHYRTRPEEVNSHRVTGARGAPYGLAFIRDRLRRIAYAGLRV